MKRNYQTVVSMLTAAVLLGGCAAGQPTVENRDTAVQKEAVEEAASTDGNEDSTAAEETTEQGKPVGELTAGELEEYTEWIQEYGNYGFLLSDWSNLTELNLWEVFYNGAGISESATKEQVDAYLEQTGQEELYTDFFVISMVKMNAFLEEKVGCFYREILERGNMTMEDAYVPATGCFSLEVGDTNYTPFRVESGERTEDGRILLHYRNEHLWSEDVAWVEAGVVQIQEENRQFLCNHITEGYILDSYQDEENWGEDNEESTGECLIPQEVFDNLQTDADASAVENEYVLGDWSQITKEALQGIWYYHPSNMGEDTSYDVILQLDGEDAIVYYPSVDFYGDVRYEWDIIDRSERGLCPELAIYWNGRDWGELAWYILGISENQEYFWCNGEVFYKQNH